MRKSICVPKTLLLLILLTIFVGVSLNTSAEAKQRRSSGKKASGKTKAASAKAGSGKSRRTASSRSKSSRRNVVARSNRRRRAAASNDREVQSLLSKRGKLTRAERQKLSRSRSSRSRRARALALARLRALRARDEALRNSAASNIEKDDVTGEDLEIRQAAVNALHGRSGTVVVMDPNNGRIFTIVNQQMALGSPVKPCSTTKLIVGLAALHENVFDPNEDVQFGRTASMNLTDALARSNNPVFQVLGQLLGYDRIIKYSSNFGFGAKTGVNYPGESDGFLPEDETNLYASHGDGFGVTAMQLAAFTGAIANGGNLYTPRVPRTVEDAESFRPELKRQIEMTPEDRMRLLSGMIGAVNYGTGRLSFNPLGQVAGKTGTCTGNRDKLGLFTSFSSADNPRVVVTVITTGSTEAGKRAAEIAGRIYAAISPRFFRERMVTPAAATTEIAAPKLGNLQN